MLERLDISATSVHLKRRIWQETLSALFLTDKECKIPKDQSMTFAQARDSVYPPYLLDFTGSPGARHVENLKVGLLMLRSLNIANLNTDSP